MSVASPKLILGAGRKPGHYTTKPGLSDITIDKAKAAGADFRQDLTQQSIPFPDAYFAEVYFEFFPHDALCANQHFALKEAVRVLMPGGLLRIDTGRPTQQVAYARLVQEVRSVLEAEGFVVTENAQVRHLQMEATKP